VADEVFLQVHDSGQLVFRDRLPDQRHRHLELLRDRRGVQSLRLAPIRNHVPDGGNADTPKWNHAFHVGGPPVAAPR
jgi:hypothetical protein